MFELGIDYKNKRLVLKRLGKGNNKKARPLMVTMLSRADVILAIKNKRKLTNNIIIAEDQTQIQRDKYKQLKQKVIENNAQNPDNQQVIKYINGIPTIIQVNADSNIQRPSKNYNNNSRANGSSGKKTKKSKN